MNPAEPAWPGVLAATGFLLWLVAVGLPMAHLLLSDRRGAVWAAYAPAVGLILHITIVNVVMYVLPGIRGAWVGLALLTVLSGVTAWRGRLWNRARPSFAAATVSGVTIAFFLFALAARSNYLVADEPSYYTLSSMMTAGSFPPVSPFTPDLGIAYHYGAHLLTTTVMSVSGLPVWTAFQLASPFLVTVLAVTVSAFCYDLTRSKGLAIGAALVITFATATVAGLPQIHNAAAANGAAGLLTRFGIAATHHPGERIAPLALNAPHAAFGLITFLVAATAIGRGASVRTYALTAVCLTTVALASTTIYIMMVPAVGLITTTQLIRRDWSERLRLAGILAAGLATSVVAGGVLSDALLRGTSSTSAFAISMTMDLKQFLQMLTRVAPLTVIVGQGMLLLLCTYGAVRFLRLPRFS